MHWRIIVMKLTALALTLALALALAAIFVWAAPATVKGLQQVVLVYDHQESDGRVIVVPKAITVMALTPVRPRRLGALPPGTLMICQPFTQRVALRTLDGKELGYFDEIAFKCAGDVFLFSAMDLHPEGKR
jgi:hypothetical protein